MNDFIEWLQQRNAALVEEENELNEMLSERQVSVTDVYLNRKRVQTALELWDEFQGVCAGVKAQGPQDSSVVVPIKK